MLIQFVVEENNGQVNPYHFVDYLYSIALICGFWCVFDLLCADHESWQVRENNHFDLNLRPDRFDYIIGDLQCQNCGTHVLVF